MTLKYECTNAWCHKKNDNQQQIDLPAELVMDEKNVAEMYCPKCKRKLKKVK